MQFHEMLNDYLRRLNVTALELAAASELSPAVISRYRSAERTPAPDSEALTPPLRKGLRRCRDKKGMSRCRRKACLGAFARRWDMRNTVKPGWRQISTCSSTCSTFGLAKWRGH